MNLALALAAISVADAGDIESLVAGLGLESDYRSVEAVGRFGCRAVPALVRQLEVVGTNRVLRHEEERHPREIRVAWTIAALRHITDTDFYAPRVGWSDPAAAGVQVLTRGAPPDSTKFFGVWQSRGSYYFSTPAQQRTIIEQWRRYSSSGVCRDGRRNRDFYFWLYGASARDPRAGLSGTIRLDSRSTAAADDARGRSD